MSEKVFVFYDLETTGLLRSGQIMNFCFIVTDPQLNEIDRLVGEVKLSHLQLPSAGAIAATRINVLKHNETATYTEQEANSKIQEFLEHRCYGQRAPLLIGYNSAKFDVHQTRWSFARTGARSFVLSRGYDVFQGVRDLLLTNPQFRKDLFADPSMAKFVSLRLEKISKFLKIDKGPQRHHSEPDVELLIDTYRELNTRYGMSAEGQSIYHVENLHEGEFADLAQINRRIYPKNFTSKYSAGYVGTIDNKFAVWIPLDRTPEEIHQDPLGKLRVIKMSEEPVFGRAMAKEVTDANRQTLQAAKEEFALIKNAKDLFPETPGEYETWIYRNLDVPKHIRACQKNPAKTNEIIDSLSGTEKEDLKYCLERLKLDSCPTEDLLSVHKEEFLNFVEARYGGKMIVDISYDPESLEAQSEYLHPDFATMYLEIDKELAKAKDNQVIECLRALKQYYEESPIRVAYEELVSCGRLPMPKVALPQGFFKDPSPVRPRKSLDKPVHLNN